MVNFTKGTLQDRKGMSVILFYDLVLCPQPGRNQDWREVRDELGDRYIRAQNIVC